MKIKLTSSNKCLLLDYTSDFTKANVIAKALIKRGYSDVYYTLEHEGEVLAGSIDLEPQSFHAPHLSHVVTWHLLTYLGNVSKLTPPCWQFNEDDLNLFRKMYSVFTKEINKQTAL